MSGWFFFALLAWGFWGLWGFFSKIAAGHLPNWAIFLVQLGVYMVMGVFIIFFIRTPVTWSATGVLAAMGVGLSGGCGLFFFLKALATGPATVVVPLTSLYPVITVILGVLFLQENLTLRHLAGIILAVGAVWFLSE
ncbi:MAG: EamA family transporter [Deltaproteobacteria bacterium]|nr:EamA family transporter [Deltaproteobacteria bacterium]